MKNHVYILNTQTLENKDAFDFWYSRMMPERRQKIDAFRFNKDKRLSLGAGILINEGLSRAGISDIKLSYGESGKPYVSGISDVYFNLSHSEKTVVCAVSDREVGIDAEAFRHFKEKLINYVFLPSEQNIIRKNPEETDRLCTGLWTIKESVMKYFGTGISMGAKKICVDISGSVSASCEGFDADRLHFTQYELRDCLITVCSEYDSFAEKLEWIDL